MRADMKKVIVSRPRVGGGKTPRDKVNYRHLCDLEAFDSGPGKESLRRRHDAYHGWSGGSKLQTDLFGPLRRFLQHRVGQHWDQVWAEICHHADARSVMGSHLRAHVREYVAKVVEAEDGTLYGEDGRSIPRWGWGF